MNIKLLHPVLIFSTGEKLLATDLQHCDNYMLLAAHLLLDIWRETGEKVCHLVFSAIVLLYFGDTASYPNSHSAPGENTDRDKQNFTSLIERFQK